MTATQSTSEQQTAAWRSKTAPPLEQVRPDVWALGMPLNVTDLGYSLVYLLRDADGGLHLVDTGVDSNENWQRLVDAVAQLGSSVQDVRTITATHGHEDHLGMAARIREASGARLALHEREQRSLDDQLATALTPELVTGRLDEWGVPLQHRAGLLAFAAARGEVQSHPVQADVLLVEGDGLAIAGFSLRVLLSAGHTPGHLSLVDDERGLVFTGDHLIATVFAGLGLGASTVTNPLADYVAGLEAVAAYPDFEALPGHGYRFTGISERAAVTREHHLRRSREVAAAIDADPGLSVWQIASRLTWTSGWANLDGLYLYSALSQTAMHRGYVQAGSPA